MKKKSIARQEAEASRIRKINTIVSISVVCLILAGTVFGYFVVNKILDKERRETETTTTETTLADITFADVTDGTLITDANRETSPANTSATTTTEKPVEEKAVSKVVYAKTKLNVRSKPSKESNIKDSLKIGDKAVVVAETDNGWYKLDNGYYISKDYVSEEPVITVTPTVSPDGTITPTPAETKETEETTKAEETKETEETTKKAEEVSTGPKAGTIISDVDPDNMDKYFVSYKISEGDAVYKRINGKSYKKNDNIKLSDLRYIKVLHVNFNGEYQVGEMIVNKSIASDVLTIFKKLCKEKYQIKSMYLIDKYWTGDASSTDWASIEANNTSCFCYRAASGSSKLSKHARGLAIDLNPLQNPYVSFKNGKASCSHDGSKKYMTDRTDDMPHVITKNDKAYKLFKDYGFTWGGSWNNPKDYQHFQK